MVYIITTYYYVCITHINIPAYSTCVHWVFYITNIAQVQYTNLITHCMSCCNYYGWKELSIYIHSVGSRGMALVRIDNVVC